MAVSVALITLLGFFFNYLFERMRLPGLVGMLLVGVVCGPYVLDIISQELLEVSSDFRMVALIVILLRAGLELRKDTLNRVGKTALVMSSVPALFEGVAITLMAPWLLGLSYLESAILGTIIAAVSPAVVVPLMIKFIDQRRGAKKGIPTLLLSASSVNDVFVIVIFTILLGMYTGSGGEGLWKLAEIPESIIFGIIAGAIIGYLICRLFERYNFRATKMAIALVCVSIILTWLEDELKTILAMSSLLGVMTIGFIILENSEIRARKISQKFSKVWILAEILLFVLVGAQVNIQVAWDAGLAGSVLVIAGLIARSAGTYLSVLGAGLNLKEKLFCVISYIPKATVQAAIGAVPLEMGVAGGEIILSVAVVSIILTAPLGAIGISLAGERWLKREWEEGKTKDE